MIYWLIVAVALMSPAVASAADTTSIADVFVCETNSCEGTAERKGFAYLTRQAEGLLVEVVTDGLEPEWAYQLWWLVFNDPFECKTRNCGGDLNTFEARPTAFLFGAGSSDRQGNLFLNAFVPRGYTPTNRDADVRDTARGGPGGSLQNTFGAQIYVFVRAKGALLSGPAERTRQAEQFGTFGEGCRPGEDCRNVRWVGFPPMKNID